MCGITGYWSSKISATADLVSAMSQEITYRGPDADADGVWLDENAGLALAHRRLSILDLSQAGAQPMVSSDQKRLCCTNQPTA